MSFKKLDLFPTEPGVYIMKNASGGVLYVGKANNLRQRVKQYFVPGRDGREMVPFLISKVADIETIIVHSEKEALLLENNLIKKHQPTYNALLKDDKAYIALKINNHDEWPRVQIVRYKGTPEPDGLYFGPYTSAHSARQTLDLLNRLFPLRQCSDQELARRKRPCLLYQMGRCIGPCGGLCSKDEYNIHLQRTIKFLKGQDREILNELYEDMKRYSDSLDFEKAAETLQIIRSIEKTIEQQSVDKPLGGDADAWGLYRHGEEVVLCQLLFREGKLISSRHYNFTRIAEEDFELFESFLLQHYQASTDKPKDIYVPVDIPSKEAIEEVLHIRLHYPQRGDKRSLIEMAQKNAEALYKAEQSEEAMIEKTLMEMKERFELLRYPKRMECFDTSNIAGTEAVASMVVFTDGQKDSKRYRQYKLHIPEKPDDYAAMNEVLGRRYRRAKEESDLPDLLIVDGGKGQLNIALRILEELDLKGVIDVIGLAKEMGRHDKGLSADQVFLPNRKDPIILKSHSPLLFLLQRIRDEAHRFAIQFHRKRRSKKTVRSSLTEIPGIGPSKCKALLKQFGSLKNIRQAGDEELKKVKGISGANIASIRKFLDS